MRPSITARPEHAPAIPDPVLPVLLVEDNMADVRLVLRRLRGEQYGVRHVRTGVEALELIERERFQVIILDHRLPDIPGTKICRMVREEDQDVPILILSSLADDALADAAFQAGATDYLVKDIAMRDLARFIDRLVEAT